jgi:hydrogenase maturation protease
MTHPAPASAIPVSRTVVLGLGNPVRRDDGVGLAVAEAVRQALVSVSLPAVEVATSTRAGFEIIDLLHGCSRAIIVDCLDVPRPRPGRVRRLDLDAVQGAPRLVDAHGLSLPLVFRLAHSLGISMPSQVEILGVEAGDCMTLGETLTPAVQAAVEPLARKILLCLALARRDPTVATPHTVPQPARFPRSLSGRVAGALRPVRAVRGRQGCCAPYG